MGCKDRKTSCKETVKKWKWSTNKPVHVLCYYKAVLLFSGLKPNTPQWLDMSVNIRLHGQRVTYDYITISSHQSPPLIRYSSLLHHTHTQSFARIQISRCLMSYLSVLS